MSKVYLISTGSNECKEDKGFVRTEEDAKLAIKIYNGESTNGDLYYCEVFEEIILTEEMKNRPIHKVFDTFTNEKKIVEARYRYELAYCAHESKHPILIILGQEGNGRFLITAKDEEEAKKIYGDLRTEIENFTKEFGRDAAIKIIQHRYKIGG